METIEDRARAFGRDAFEEWAAACGSDQRPEPWWGPAETDIREALRALRVSGRHDPRFFGVVRAVEDGFREALAEWLDGR